MIFDDISKDISNFYDKYKIPDVYNKLVLFLKVWNNNKCSMNIYNILKFMNFEVHKQQVRISTRLFDTRDRKNFT